MKRALFKLGKKFQIESRTEKDHYEVIVETDKWLLDPNNWTFDYEIIEDEENLPNPGTFIKVTDLNEDVSNEFTSSSFLSSLQDEIEKALNFSLEKNIKITLNGIKLEKKGISLIRNDKLVPYHKELSFKNGEIITVKIFAGLSEPSPDDGGWYIYCNDRLVLAADKTILTGWEGRRFGESTVRKYHNYFAMFRGVVFFDSKDSKKLPMTTTKTGVDSNSVVYQVTKVYMIESMLQVISFLNDIATKLEEPELYRKELIESSDELDIINLKKLEFSEEFKHPIVDKEEKDENEETTISYKANRELVKILKKNLKVTTNKDVGKKTFEYFLDMEGIEKPYE